ncbi:glycosyltransferase family 2 protein [Agrobacterium sp. Ap1]|uniref:glycosyltransferase family 2 protein n=1 Tax=Agrobacterium sp. Ap1 TaxID=2815337 RepID=UPI001A8E92BB|nr:glycosyltransferase family 2 protein [Agrobacterium sp. Ap1]MBO0140025.1 glycosyltransferase family 2 protein [Agrobacterium sp. Ap1]
MTADLTVARIDIGICTYRRPALKETLESLFKLTVPAGASLRLIVADNDAVPSASDLVESLRQHSPFPILYVHCPKSNISIARNACLTSTEADFLAFIDDDETATPEWLAALYENARQTGAEAVLGPVRALYGDDSAAWMRNGDFHSTMPVWVDGRIITGYTCNTLLDMRSPLVIGRRFALALGQSGGEDTHFFSQLTESGGRIEFAEDALVLEPVPASRASFMWLAKRRFRSGQTHGRIVAAKNGGVKRFPKALIAATKAGYCGAIAAAFTLMPVKRNRYALRGALHVGAVMGMLGVREIRQYGTPEAA